jgi:hypothetical protein
MSYGVGEVTSSEASLSVGPDRGAMELTDNEESSELSEERLIREPKSMPASKKRQIK